MTSPRLFLIDGTSGIWKDAFVRYVDHVLVEATVVRKVSTRPSRPNEKPEYIDLEHVDDAAFDRVPPDYGYEYGGYRYGIHRQRIDHALECYSSVFLVVRNVEIIRRLKTEYRAYRPTSAFIYMDRQWVTARADELGGQDLLESVENAFLDYLRNPGDYDEVIINAGFDNDFYRLIDLLIQRGAARTSSRYKREGPEYKIVVASSVGSRRLLQAILGVVSAACIAFSINLTTQGNLDYWRLTSLVFCVALLLFTLFVELALLVAWRERE